MKTIALIFCVVASASFAPLARCEWDGDLRSGSTAKHVSYLYGDQWTEVTRKNVTLEPGECKVWRDDAEARIEVEATFEVVHLPKGCSVEDLLVTPQFHHEGECLSTKAECKHNKAATLTNANQLCDPQKSWLEPAFSWVGYDTLWFNSNPRAHSTSGPVCTAGRLLVYVMLNKCQEPVTVEHVVRAKRTDSCKAEDWVTSVLALVIGVPLIGLVVFLRFWGWFRICGLGRRTQNRYVLVQTQQPGFAVPTHYGTMHHSYPQPTIPPGESRQTIAAGGEYERELRPTPNTNTAVSNKD